MSLQEFSNEGIATLIKFYQRRVAIQTPETETERLYNIRLNSIIGEKNNRIMKGIYKENNYPELRNECLIKSNLVKKIIEKN